ncbi:MAG TPA: AhpC/TSA family protein [Polyangia bacterium]|nr:AhpC/TSA family protein [Polyangia bacterium]
MFCAQQVAEFRPHYSELRERGVNVAVIGSGSPHFARAFVEDRDIEMPVYSDEKRASFEAAGLKRGFCRVIDPRVMLKGARAIFKYRQRKTMGDAFQQGGVLIVRRDGTVPYHYVSEYAGDHPPTADVVAEVFRAAAA